MMMPFVVVSVLLLLVRFYAAMRVGFGDSEALYATWAVHPQPAYLDHPGLVGIVARAIGEGTIPSPTRVHIVTSVVATAIPWIAYGAARAFGADKRPAMVSALLVALVPEMAIGLFALTPDLLLAPLWLGALALAAIGLRAPANESRSAIALLFAGLLAGVACAAKVSGALLVVALAVTYVSLARSKFEERAAARSVWPWAGLATGIIILAPVVQYEVKRGFPMLQHRLIETQHDAGLTLRNVGALVGGQLIYLSPLVAWLAFVVARDLFRDRNRDALSRLCFYAFAIPIVPLAALTVWSRVAEPHWVAPALLALPIHAARRTSWHPSRRLYLASAGVAAFFTVAVHAWVLVPSASRLLPESFDPKLDISSELYGWPTVADAIRDQISAAATPFDPEGREVVVVGPHWTVCAQLHASLPGLRVGCATPIPDDFDGWFPRSDWRKSEHVLFVTDNRFDGDGSDQLPAHMRIGQSRVRILRGGRTARVFELYLYENRASTSREPEPSRRGGAEVRETLRERAEKGAAEEEVHERPAMLAVPGAPGGHDSAVAE